MTRRLLSLLLLLAAWCGPRLAHAQDFTTTSPGALSSSHGALDDPAHCNDCHNGDKTLRRDKCLGCHDHARLNQKIVSGRGFHSRAKVTSKQCWDCHLEHKGRSFDILGWAAVGGTAAFDHDTSTDFKLLGKHAAIRCEDCHTRRDKQGLRVFMNEASVCGSCHKKDQPHNFERAEMMKCDRCHSEITWKPPKRVQDFDHDDRSQASFPLEGSHADVACAKCHPKAEFNLKKDVSQCSACHDNPHVGHLYGKVSCAKCHSPKLGSLAKIEFNHNTQTRFRLDGKHAAIACYDCHPKGVESKPSRACESCHKKDNRHGERFNEFGSPPACGICHGTRAWLPGGETFDHQKRAGWKLEVKHATAKCRDCHRGKSPDEFERFQPVPKMGCMGCHQHANVHKKEYKNTPSTCLKCHKHPGDPGITSEGVKDIHGPSGRWPITLGHVGVACEKCHENDQWKISGQCGDSCHEDSLHKGSLGKECSRCHAAGEWAAKKFDHDRDSSYKLIGQHKGGRCEACHLDRVFKPTPTNCGATQCHKADDAHRERLGNKCERCHSETGANIFEHNVQAEFKLKGKHLDVPCKNCHPTLEFKPRPKNCFGCHPEPNVHKGLYGTRCQSCHSETSFKNIKPIHDVGSFSLTGAHDQIACVRCHKDSRSLAGTGNLCVTCHQRDDIHHNSLGPQCGQCHTQRSFAPAHFDHTTVGCNLRGQHRTLPCADCHKGGNYAGLSTDCYSCHWPDAAKLATHQNTGRTECGTCHDVNTWLHPQLPPTAGTSWLCQ
jgi:hypothetical protein